MRNYLILIAIFIPAFLFSQQDRTIDSLQAVFPSASDTQKITICSALFQEYKNIDLDRALKYAQEALNFSRKVNDRKRIAESYFHLSTAHIIRQEDEKAGKYIQQALGLFKNMNDKTWISKCLFNSAMLHKNKGEYIEAIKIYQPLLKEKSEQGDTVFMMAILNNMGNIYSERAVYDSAQSCYYRAFAINEKRGDIQGVAQTLSVIASLNGQMGENIQAINNAKKSLRLMYPFNNQTVIANNLYTVGKAYYEINRYDSSEYYAIRALRAYQEMGDIQSIADSKFMMGNIFFEKKEYAKAKKYFSEALDESKDSEDLLKRGYAFHELANINYQDKNYLAAEVYADSSISIYRKIDSKHYLSEVYELFAEISVKTGNYRKAHACLLSAMALKDSIFKQERIKSIIEIEKKYEAEKKQQAITQLTRQNRVQELELEKKSWQLYGLTGGILILVLSAGISILFLRQRKLSADQKGLELEQRLLRSQMNPHFIFNALGSIQNFILENNPTEAVSYLARFAKLMRMVLENSRELSIPVSKEISMLEHYLELQQLAVSQPFDYKIEIDPAIDPERTEIPPMLSQPFIENAIKHGLNHKQDKGRIYVHFLKKDMHLLIEVEDNGMGFLQSQLVKHKPGNEHQSLATIITKDRIANLNKGRRNKILLVIRELTEMDNTILGTKIIIDIPLTG